ncbi:MAG: hypothetical protein GY851_19440 [bacterium]|nr:hypothetical protein [bacterium]
MHRFTLFTLLAFACCAAGETQLFELTGVADAGANDGEAKSLDKEGIYCWWAGPGLRPGYVEIHARARALEHPGVLHFVITDNADPSRVYYAVTETQHGRVAPGPYQIVYCGTFFWDGSFSPRISDWSSPGLMVDWVKLVPVAAADVRDPLPDAVDRYNAPRFPDAPTIDGELSEWTRVPCIVLGTDAARSADYGGTADLSAVCRFAWDDLCLYFAAEVTDNLPEFLDDTRHLGRLWQYDSIQLAFDGNGEARTPGYEADDYEYGFGLTSDGPRVYRWVAGNNLPVGDVPTIDVAVVRDDASNRTLYEAALPFKELLPFTVARGECGMTLLVDDRDEGRQQHAWLEWAPGIAGSKDPSAFGRLRLVDAPPSAGGVAAMLVGERDLSDRNATTMELRVSAPEPIGTCTLVWCVVDDTVRAVLEGSRVVKLDDPDATVPIDLDLSDLGQGRFTMKADLVKDHGDLTSVSTEFFRFAAAEIAATLDLTRARLTETLASVDAVRKNGVQAAYPRATLGAVEEFVRFTKADIEAKRFERAEATLAELDALLDEAEAELATLVADPASDRPVPSVGDARVSARDGSFYRGDDPVLLFGYCGWWQVWTAAERLAAQGLNHIEDSIISPAALFPEWDAEPPSDMMDALRWAWVRGDRAGISYSRMLACEQIPRTFREAHPEALGGGWTGLCSLSPALREFESRYLTTVARTAKDRPSMGVYVLYGEKTYHVTDHPLEAAAFAEYLKARYGTLEALNQAWGASHASWEVVGAGTTTESPVAWHDRGRCAMDLLVDWTRWLQEQVQGVDPAALCTGYPSLLSWDDSSDFSAGVDMEGLCRTLNVNGFDTAALEYGGARWAMSSITGFAMPNDLLKAFNPENPNYDPELHLTNLKRPYPEEYIRAALFQGCFHGLGAASYWVFQRSEGMDSMLIFQPRVMASFIRTSLDCRRLVRPILAFQHAPSDAAILYSLTSIAYNPRHLQELRAAYEGTFFSDTKMSFVTERIIQEEGIDKTVLILPEVSHLPVAVAEKIVEWSKAGGTLILLGDCFAKDTKNRPLNVAPGQEHNIVRLGATGDPQAVRAAMEPVFDTVLHRPLRAVDDTDATLDGVEMRLAEYDGKRLGYAINMNKQPVTFDLAPRPSGAIRELRTCRDLTLPCRLDPLDIVVFSIQP